MTDTAPRTARWTVHTTYDDRNVKVSVAWTATDSAYTVRRAPGNQFVIENASGDFVGAHGTLSDALDDIEELEVEETACKTPGAVYHTSVLSTSVAVSVDLPTPLVLTEAEAEALEAELHSAVESVLARFF